MSISRNCTPPTNTYLSFDSDNSRRVIFQNDMITKLLESQSFSRSLKTAARQKFCAIVSQIWPRNIIRGLLKETNPVRLSDEFHCKHWEKITSVILELRLKKNVSGQFHVTEMTYRGQFFGNKTFFDILLFSSFCLKFVEIFLTWYLTISRKETLISFTRAVNMFVLNSVTDITKKINLQCYIFKLKELFLWINMSDKNSIIIMRTWLNLLSKGN